MVDYTGIKMGEGDWKVLIRFPGVVEHGMLVRMHGNPGDPSRSLKEREQVGTSDNKARATKAFADLVRKRRKEKG